MIKKDSTQDLFDELPWGSIIYLILSRFHYRFEKKNEYLPFRKENAKNIYMNFISIHPYLIKREIQSMIQKRLSSLSKTEERYLEKKKIHMKMH